MSADLHKCLCLRLTFLAAIAILGLIVVPMTIMLSLQGHVAQSTHGDKSRSISWVIAFIPLWIFLSCCWLAPCAVRPLNTVSIGVSVAALWFSAGICISLTINYKYIKLDPILYSFTSLLSALLLIAGGAIQRLESAVPDPQTQLSRLLLPIWALDIVLLAALLWEMTYIFCRRANDDGTTTSQVSAIIRLVVLVLLITTTVPSEIILTLCDEKGYINVGALFGPAIALSGLLALGGCCFAYTAYQRERAREIQDAILAHALGPNQGTRSCYRSSPSRQRGLGGHVIVVMHSPGLSPVEM